MTTLSIAFFIRIGIALIAGFIVARRLRRFVRSSVIRSMPLEKRMSEQSYSLQTRISTLIGFIIALLAAALANLGLLQLEEMIDIPVLTQNTSSTTISDFEEEEASLFASSNWPSEIEEPITIDAIRDSLPQSDSYDELPSGNMKPLEKGAYYLQLYAFNSQELAMSQLFLSRSQLDKPVMLGKVEYTLGPYKILAGPFPSRVAARAYRDKYKLTGFTRHRKEFVPLPG